MGSHGTHAPQVKGGGHLKPLLLLESTTEAVEEDLVVEQPGPPHPTTTAMRGTICGGAKAVSRFGAQLEGDGLVGREGPEHLRRVAGRAWSGIAVLLGCIILGTHPSPVQLQYMMLFFLVTMYFCSHKPDVAQHLFMWL